MVCKVATGPAPIMTILVQAPFGALCSMVSIACIVVASHARVKTAWADFCAATAWMTLLAEWSATPTPRRPTRRRSRPSRSRRGLGVASQRRWTGRTRPSLAASRTPSEGRPPTSSFGRRAGRIRKSSSSTPLQLGLSALTSSTTCAPSISRSSCSAPAATVTLELMK